MRQCAKWVLYPPQGGACRMGLAWVIPPASRLAGGESRARAEVQNPGVRTCLSPRWVRTRWTRRSALESGAGGLLSTVCGSDASTFLVHVGHFCFGVACRVFSAWDPSREELLIAPLPPCRLELTAFCLRRQI